MSVIINDFDVRSEPPPSAPAAPVAQPVAQAAIDPRELDRSLEKLAARYERLRAR